MCTQSVLALVHSTHTHTHSHSIQTDRGFCIQVRCDWTQCGYNWTCPLTSLQANTPAYLKEGEDCVTAQEGEGLDSDEGSNSGKQKEELDNSKGAIPPQQEELDCTSSESNLSYVDIRIRSVAIEFVWHGCVCVCVCVCVHACMCV